MSYCNIGDKPKVIFHFGSEGERYFQSNVSPIDVTVETFYPSGTDNYEPSGYKISAYSPNNGTYISAGVRDYKIVDNGANQLPIYRYELFVQLCSSAGLTSYTIIDPATLQIDTSVTCGDNVPKKKKARLHVKKTGEFTDIFTSEGDIPCMFQVACGNCPDGYCECPTPGYPGYCCLDCNSAAASIRAITNELRGING